MKKIFLILLVLIGCKSKQIDDFDKLQKEYNKRMATYDSFNIVFYRRNDSCRAINIFIDNLPYEIKSLPDIRNGYKRNLDYLQTQNNIRIFYNDRIGEIIDQQKKVLYPSE